MSEFSQIPDPSLISPGRLDGRRILVVGAGQRRIPDDDPPVGNGRAMAVAAAMEGAMIAAMDVDSDAASATVESIEAHGGKAVPIVADAADSAACKAGVLQASEALGGLDGVVLNVGTIANELTLEKAESDWDRLFAVNVRSHFLATRYALTHLEDGSSVVFISSIAAYLAFDYDPAYDASKAAVEGLCRGVALEGSPRRIRANAVRIGHVQTPLNRFARARPGAHMSANAGGSKSGRGPLAFPLGFGGTSWEIAAVVTFLLSDQSRWMTGQILNVDGGATALFPSGDESWTRS